MENAALCVSRAIFFVIGCAILATLLPLSQEFHPTSDGKYALIIEPVSHQTERKKEPVWPERTQESKMPNATP